MHPVFVQAFYYGILMVLTVVFVGLLQKGFFFPYIKVRMSFGKLLLVKVRSINRDYFAAGKIDEGFLVYKHGKDEKRIKIDNRAAFYKAISVSWIDVDEEKNAVMITDYNPVEGFDAIKYTQLYLRALYRPSLSDNKEKIMFALLIVACILALISAGVGYMNYQQLAKFSQVVAALSQKANTVITGGVI